MILSVRDFRGGGAKVRPGIANQVLCTKTQKPEFCLAKKCYVKTGLWNNNKVSFCHISLPQDTAGARPNSVPFVFTKLGQKPSIEVPCHRRGSPFFVKLKGNYL